MIAELEERNQELEVALKAIIQRSKNEVRIDPTMCILICSLTLTLILTLLQTILVTSSTVSSFFRL